MTNEQLYIAIGVPAALYILLTTILMAYVNAKMDGMGSRVNDRFESVDRQFAALEHRFDAIQKQNVELKETLRAEMREMRADIRLEIKESADRRLIGGR